MSEDALSKESQILKTAGLALDALTVYRQLPEGDRVIGRLRALIGLCQHGQLELRVFLDHYGDLFAAMADSGADLLDEYLIEAVLLQDNAFTRSLERSQAVPSHLVQAAAHDLDCLQQLACLGPAVFKASALEQCSCTEAEAALVNNLPEWQCVRHEGQERGCFSGALSAVGQLPDRYLELNRQIVASGRWSDLLQDLNAFHCQYGAGIFARYRAFYWDQTAEIGCLKGIANPDPVTLSDLIGYESERADVIENTLQFLNGFHANNVLLYGDRGTGKSATVKALLNEYHERGLRLVEVSKAQLPDFPGIIRQLRERGHKFIIFVDDLSFEESEGSYAALKAVLEGGLEYRPDNVLIYATSNRRHLIKEQFGDRDGLQSGRPHEDVHAGDTIQEKLSLADRFGITVIFPTPDQGRYLEIAEGIAARRGLKIDHEHLQRAALNWERWHNGRSPRTARQFVDWLEGNIAKI